MSAMIAPFVIPRIRYWVRVVQLMSIPASGSRHV
jgi:hypothetical protein